MKPVGYHLTSIETEVIQTLEDSVTNLVSVQETKINGLPLFRVAQISSHTAALHAVKKLNVNTVPLMQFH